MATVGFAANEEQKKRIDELAEQFTRDTGKSKSDFLVAMTEAFEMNQAKVQLRGRVDEIEAFEKLLSDCKQMYLSSLVQAKSAKETAINEVNNEIEKSKKLHETLQSKIDELESKLTEAEVINKENEALKTENELLTNKLAKAERAKEESEAERADLSKIFKEQIASEKEKVASFIDKANKFENLKNELEALKKQYRESEYEMKIKYENQIETLKKKYDDRIEKYENRIESYLLNDSEKETQKTTRTRKGSE